MSIRNYVGARYVPKFANPVEWQANTSYEAMVIVTYNNSSYTSKIPVPSTVGNPAENSTYWALTGNYNAQVEEYRQESTKAKDGICSVDERNNVAAAYTHKPDEYFWWKGKLYRAMKNIDVGAPLTVERNIKEENVTTGVYINTVEIAKTINALNLFGDNVDTNSKNIAQLQSNVRSNTYDITSIKEKSMELEGDINHLREDVSHNGTGVATNKNNIEALQTNQSYNTNAITRLEDTSADNTNKINGLQRDVSRNTSDITSLKTTTTELDNKINNHIQYKVYTTRKNKYPTPLNANNLTDRLSLTPDLFVEPVPADTTLIPISARYLYYQTEDEYNNPNNKGRNLLTSAITIEPRETTNSKTFFTIHIVNNVNWTAVGDYWMLGVLEIKHS